MRDRRNWQKLGKEEQALRIKRMRDEYNSLAVKPQTGAEWRELAYKHNVPELRTRAELDPTRKGWYEKVAEQIRRRRAIKIPGQPNGHSNHE